jgi:hypothetical protein
LFLFTAHEDTGMMGTLFIGPPDEVFDWREHIPMLTGIGIGILAGVVLMMAGISFFRAESEQSMKEYYYSVVAMNEVKSKVLD